MQLEDESELDLCLLLRRLSWREIKLDLHSVVGRAAAAFGANPVDVLLVVFDITRFAVDAVLSVDHKPLTVDAVFTRHKLVDS